jgi:ribA/ribD-fused uncharacterized protein
MSNKLEVKQVKAVEKQEPPISTFKTKDFQFLCNFYPCKIIYDGIEYPSSEHAFQAAKTLDGIERLKICDLSTPVEAKRAGRKLKSIRPDWDNIRLQIMEDIVRAKFTQHPELAAKLKATGNRELIEGNWWNDTFWGVCNGVGENNLGKILMKIRSKM